MISLRILFIILCMCLGQAIASDYRAQNVVNAGDRFLILDHQQLFDVDEESLVTMAPNVKQIGYEATTQLIYTYDGMDFTFFDENFEEMFRVTANHGFDQVMIESLGDGNLFVFPPKLNGESTARVIDLKNHSVIDLGVFSTVQILKEEEDTFILMKGVKNVVLTSVDGNITLIDYEEFPEHLKSAFFLKDDEFLVVNAKKGHKEELLHMRPQGLEYMLNGKNISVEALESNYLVIHTNGDKEPALIYDRDLKNYQDDQVLTSTSDESSLIFPESCPINYNLECSTAALDSEFTF